MGGVNVRYGTMPARAFFDTEFLQFLLNKPFPYIFPSGLENKL